MRFTNALAVTAFLSLAVTGLAQNNNNDNSVDLADGQNGNNNNNNNNNNNQNNNNDDDEEEEEEDDNDNNNGNNNNNNNGNNNNNNDLRCLQNDEIFTASQSDGDPDLEGDQSPSLTYVPIMSSIRLCTDIK